MATPSKAQAGIHMAWTTTTTTTTAALARVEKVED